MHIARDHLALEIARKRVPRKSRAGPPRRPAGPPRRPPRRRREPVARRLSRMVRRLVSGAHAYHDGVRATWAVFGAREDR
jgi:hypothetical protein